MRYKALILMVVLLGSLLVGGPALAVTPYDDVLMQQAQKNLNEGNYEEALDQLTQAWQKGTKTPDKAFYLGVVYRRTLNYPKAREFFEQALRLKPKYPEAQYLLADTLLALEKPELALPYLQELEKIGYQPTQVNFLLGIVAVKQKRYSEAVDYFQKAEQDPKVAQEAKFQKSLALAAQNRLKDAKKSMDEVITLAPETDTAGFAQRYASALERRLYEMRPFRFYGALGFDFDSNVTVQPGDATAARLVSGQGDAVYTYAASLEYNLFPTTPYGLLAQYAFYQNFHPRLTKYDLMSHTLGLVPLYKFPNARLWLPFNFNFTDLESDKYYTAYTLTPTYLHLLTPKVGLEVGTRLARKYYWFPLKIAPPDTTVTFIPNDDRSARNVGASLGLYYFLKNQEGYLQARLAYEHDFASGSNWESSTYRLFLMALYPATPRLKLSTFLDLALQPYMHRQVQFNIVPGTDPPTVILDPVTLSPLTTVSRRRDQILTFGVAATYEVYKGLEFNVHYYLVRDDSNIALYDYIRHIVGCQLGFRY